jgi:protein-arginine kinase activator protein McsA
MATEFIVNNNQEFQDMVDNKDFRISKAIVDSILSNLDAKKKNIHILSVTSLEEDSTFDITLEKKHFVQTLEENLKYFVEKEMYEDCQKIQSAINKLNQK